MKILVILVLLLLAIFPFLSFIGTDFKRCQSYLYRALVTIAFSRHAQGATIRDYSTFTDCHTIASFRQLMQMRGMVVYQQFRQHIISFKSFSVAAHQLTKISVDSFVMAQTIVAYALSLFYFLYLLGGLLVLLRVLVFYHFTSLCRYLGLLRVRSSMRNDISRIKDLEVSNSCLWMAFRMPCCAELQTRNFSVASSFTDTSVSCCFHLVLGEQTTAYCAGRVLALDISASVVSLPFYFIVLQRFGMAVVYDFSVSQHFYDLSVSRELDVNNTFIFISLGSLSANEIFHRGGSNRAIVHSRLTDIFHVLGSFTGVITNTHILPIWAIFSCHWTNFFNVLLS